MPPFLKPYPKAWHRYIRSAYVPVPALVFLLSIITFIMLRLASSANRSFITVRKEKERRNLSWFLFRFSVDMLSCSFCERAGLC